MQITMKRGDRDRVRREKRTKMRKLEEAFWSLSGSSLLFGKLIQELRASGLRGGFR
jgi:hypothetical protein